MTAIRRRTTAARAQPRFQSAHPEYPATSAYRMAASLRGRRSFHAAAPFLDLGMWEILLGNLYVARDQQQGARDRTLKMPMLTLPEGPEVAESGPCGNHFERERSCTSAYLFTGRSDYG